MRIPQSAISCRELEAADCGDVIFFPYAFMLRATAMNRIGHAQSDNERLNLSIMNDSPDNERLAPPKVTLSPESDPLRESKVTLSPESDPLRESKVTLPPKSDPLEVSIMNDSANNGRLNLSIMNDSPESDPLEAPIMNDSPNNERLETPIMNDSPKSPYAIFQHRERRMRILYSKLDKKNIRIPTINALQKVVCTFADNEVFGSRQIMSLIPCSEVTARRIIIKLKDLDLIVPIKGNGKGRYMFKELP